MTKKKQSGFSLKIEEIVKKIEEMENDETYVIDINGKMLSDAPQKGSFWKMMIPVIKNLKEQDKK